MGKDKKTTTENRLDPESQEFRDEFLRPFGKRAAREIQGIDRLTAELGPAFQEGLASLRGVQGGLGDFLGMVGEDAPSISAGSVGPFGFEAGTFDAARHEDFMNPFTEQVVDAQRATFDRQRDQVMDRAAQEATKAGAFGGSRSGILQAEALGGVNRNEAQQIANLRRQGFSEAMANALNTFGMEEQFGLQEARGQQRGDIANQQARLQAGIANQQAANQRLGLGLQGLGIGADIGRQFLGAGQTQQQVASQRLRDPILRNQAALQMAQGGFGTPGQIQTNTEHGSTSQAIMGGALLAAAPFTGGATLGPGMSMLGGSMGGSGGGGGKGGGKGGDKLGQGLSKGGGDATDIGPEGGFFGGAQLPGIGG